MKNSTLFPQNPLSCHKKDSLLWKTIKVLTKKHLISRWMRKGLLTTWNGSRINVKWSEVSQSVIWSSKPWVPITFMQCDHMQIITNRAQQPFNAVPFGCKSNRAYAPNALFIMQNAAYVNKNWGFLSPEDFVVHWASFWFVSLISSNNKIFSILKTVL